MNKESEKKSIKVADKKMEQVSGGGAAVKLPEGVVVTGDTRCRKCGYICPAGNPPCICPICGGSEWFVF